MTEALKKRDMVEPGALTTLHERGAINGEVSMSASRGGVRFENMLQVMEFAKLMAVADIGVPKHLRGNPGACMKIAIQADEWGFSPFAVADKSYVVNDRMAYESQLIHAVVEKRAPLESRLRHEFSGEGPTRRCKVIGKLIGEEYPSVWEGPMFKDIKVKNSPEWTANPDKQLFYHASRDWARIFVPDVLAGVYERDEMRESADNAKRSGGHTGTIADALPKRIEGPQDGFDSDGIAKTLSAAPGSPRAAEVVDHQSEETPTTVKRRGKKPTSEDGAGDEPDQEPETTQEMASDEPKEADLPPPPTDDTSYRAWAEYWIGHEDSKVAAQERWESEKEMRAQCRVKITTRKSLEKSIADKFK
jgi:hypothetical protein